MNQLTFGSNQQIDFGSENEFYEALGFLAKSDGSISLVWERNELSGAWGSEGRIQCHTNIAKFPLALSRAFTAGVGITIKHRINCNEYVHHIVTHHNFAYGKEQSYSDIRNTVPTTYLSDFDRGYNL